MTEFLHFVYKTIESPEFLLAVMIVSFFVKISFLGILIPRGLRTSKIQLPWLLIVGVLAGSMFSDISWIIKLIREIFFHNSDYTMVTFSIRIAWGFLVLQYQSLAFFMVSLSERYFRFNKIHKGMLFFSSIFSLYFFYVAFFETGITSELERELAKSASLAEAPLEIKIMRYVSFYLVTLVIISLIFTLRKMRSGNLPNILKKQLKFFMLYMLCPYLVVESIQIINMIFVQWFEPYLYPTVSISTLLLLYAIYYCIQSVMGLRFLNFASHVQSTGTFNFIDDFKSILEQLSYATSIQELSHLTQTFLKDAFNIPVRKATLYIRKFNTKNKEPYQNEIDASRIETTVENYISMHDPKVCAYIKKYKIFIYDEIAFSEFYDEDPVKKSLLAHLEDINADVLLPIYDKQKVIAYIIVERHARNSELYSNIEHDELLVFASYLGNIINLLRNRNFEALIHQEKELKEELYNKHQEINQYKESIRSFLRNTVQKKIGIIFYKNRHFTFGNQAAKELIKININTQEGHPLTQALKKIARQVEDYKSPQTCFASNVDGNKLVLSAVPNLEHSNIIITVHYPEVSDIVTKQIDRLKDPTKWDYLLYLETTKSGQLINQLIPGSGEILLNFKIELLKTALSKKATLLEMPEEDLLPTVELLHHISLRENLHVLSLQGQEKNFETAIKLFGINPIFNINQPADTLLKKLHNSATLFIKNIHFMDLETQDYLAEFIRYGIYRIFKSDQKVPSSVRIICSTNKNLNTAVHEGKFSSTLFHELKKTTLSMPSLLTLPEQELNELADGFTEQAIKTDTFKNLLELTEKEKNKLVMARPISLQELKTKVQHILVQKSHKNQIQHEAQFDPAYTISDPDLVEAARLGKHALRDPKIMAALWKKFKNQNQIASFLGVNRSSINRRCKEYNLQ